MRFPLEVFESLDNCLLSARSLENITWVSYNLDDGICFNLHDCPAVDVEVLFTVSSEVSCLICGAKGECLGTLLDGYLTDNSEECLEKCKSQPRCAWFAYNENSGICSVLETCDILGDSEETWISGEVHCTQTTSTTPEHSTTPSTPTTPSIPTTTSTQTTSSEQTTGTATSTTSEQSTRTEAPTTTSSPLTAELNQILWIKFQDPTVRLGNYKYINILM